MNPELEELIRAIMAVRSGLPSGLQSNGYCIHARLLRGHQELFDSLGLRMAALGQAEKAMRFLFSMVKRGAAE